MNPSAPPGLRLISVISFSPRTKNLFHQHFFSFPLNLLFIYLPQSFSIISFSFSLSTHFYELRNKKHKSHFKSNVCISPDKNIIHKVNKTNISNVWIKKLKPDRNCHLFHLQLQVSVSVCGSEKSPSGGELQAFLRKLKKCE